MNRKAKASEFIDSEYNVKVIGRHLEVTDSMKDYAIEKISKIERFINRIIEVNVIMDIQKLEHSVEIILRAGHLKITSQASCTDMYASIDKAVTKLEAQMRRYKSKIQDHHAKGHEILNMNVDVIQRPLEDDFNLDHEEASLDLLKPHQVVRQESLPLKTLTIDEAVMKMELSKDSFMLFKNEVNQRLSLIYRLEDGDYGIIEPKC